MQAGSALIAVIAASAIGLTIGLGMISQMTSMQLGINNVKFRADANTANEEIRALLSSKSACTNTFGGLVASATAQYNIAALRDGSTSPGVSVFRTGNAYGDQTILLSSMNLARFEPGGSQIGLT